MIGVLVPAHDEQALIASCLHSILVAARAPGLRDAIVEGAASVTELALEAF